MIFETTPRDSTALHRGERLRSNGLRGTANGGTPAPAFRSAWAETDALLERDLDFDGGRIDVTVAIPTYNRAGYLRQTLAGMLAQEFPSGEFEVLVIDNNSTDETPSAVAEFQNTWGGPRYVRETRQGLNHARNRAVSEARGEIIVFADDDVLVGPNWLSRLVAPLMSNGVRSRIGVESAGAEDNPPRESSIRNAKSIGTTGNQIETRHPVRPVNRQIGAVGGEVIPVFPNGVPDWVRRWHGTLAFRADAGPLGARECPMGANVAFPKWIFDEIGGFRANLDRVAGKCFSGGDSEMIERIRAADFEVWFVPSAVAIHQMPASRTRFSYVARHAFDSARSRVIHRATRPNAVRFLVGRFVANAAKALVYCVAAAFSAGLLRTGAAKKALVRTWRSCGYLYQIPLSFGRLILVRLGLGPEYGIQGPKFSIQNPGAKSRR